jgi:ribonuclease BN (tRNA processing enzyme)
MRLLCLGVGDAFSARHYSSCFALESAASPGRWLLVDCPHPIRKIVREASLAANVPLDVSQLDAVALTHLHGDHVSGLEVLAYYFRYKLNRRLPLYTHPEVARLLWSGVLTGSMAWAVDRPGEPARARHLEDFFDLHLMDENAPTAVGAFRVLCRRNIHSIPAIALKFSADSRTLGYSADTAFDPALLDWLTDGDLVIHEANSGFMHTDLKDLLTADASLLKKMRLIHCADAFDEAACPLPMMRQGAVLDI